MDFFSGRFDFDALNTQNRFIHYNSKLLYTLQKMQEMSNLNNLYNAEDVIFFCEIFMNRLQAMFERSGFNPRKCNSASKLRIQ